MADGDAGPMLMAKVDDFFAPLDFSYRALSEAVRDPDYLRKRLPDDAERVLAELEKPSDFGEDGPGFEWERQWESIMQFAHGFNGFSGLDDDFSDMGYIFRNFGGLGDSIDMNGERVCKRKLGESEAYVPADREGNPVPEGEEHPLITIEGDSGYYHREMKNMAEMAGGLRWSQRGCIIIHFEESYLDVRMELFKALEKELGVRFEVEREDVSIRSIVATQMIHRYADPIYVMAGRMVSESSTGASITLQRYNMNPGLSGLLEVFRPDGLVVS